VRYLSAALSWLSGAAVALGLMALASFHTPHVWLPVLYALIFGAWTTVLPPIREKGLGGWIVAALTLVVCGVWIRSEGLLTIGWRQATPRLLTFGWAACLLAVALILAAVWRSKLTAKESRLGWLAVTLVLATLVAQTSNSQAGASSMVPFFMRILHLDQASAETFVLVFRKTVHFSFYGFVAFSAWKAAAQAKVSPQGMLAFGLGSALILASFDEARQSTQIGRTGTIWDVLLDMVGATVILSIAHMLTMAKSPGRSPIKRAQ
jgi:VanZ family protein